MVSPLTDMLSLALRDSLKMLPRMAIAFSGGLDSRFLCHAARLCGCGVVAIHARGAHISDRDSEFARQSAILMGVPFLEANFNPFAHPEAAQNGKKRCLACKQAMLAAIQSTMRANGLEDLPLCDGGNADDKQEYRPGAQAVADFGVISPLAMSGLDKNEIRAQARKTGLRNPDQKARPCLLTRLAYGIPPDNQILAALDAAETEISAFLSAHGCNDTDFRLRLTPQPALHLTRSDEHLAGGLLQITSKYGFKDCVISVMPALSGYFDQIDHFKHE